MTSRLLVIGSANVDLFARVPRHPAPGETLLGAGGERTAGGKGANQALAAALQGAQVTFVSAVGDDPESGTALGALRAAGVDLSKVVTSEREHTGLAIITVAEDGENTIVVLPGANYELEPDTARRAAATLSSGDLLLLQGELRPETTEAAAREAMMSGRRTVLNVAPWVPLARDVLVAADPLILNEHEAQLAVSELGLNPSEDTAQGRATALRDAGTPSVVITLGAQGALVQDASGTAHVPSPRVTPVDTTGAGDAFAGALVARLLHGDALIDAVRHAVRVGAFAVQHRGAQPSYPRVDQELP